MTDPIFPKLSDLDPTKVWTLKRDTIFNGGTQGKLLAPDGSLILDTIENTNYRIRPGIFKCTRDYYHKGKHETFEIQYPDIDGDGDLDRDRLLFHAANYGAELRGCIAPGMARGFTEEDLPAVWQSKTALNKFLTRLKGVDEFWLHVIEPEDSYGSGTEVFP